MEKALQILNHPAVFLLTFLLLDLIFGDPNYRLHPIRLFGDILNGFEFLLRKLKLDGYFGGFLLFIFLFITLEGIILGLYFLLKYYSPWAAYFWYLFIAWHMIAVKDLCAHGIRVAKASDSGDIEKSRQHTSMMVSRNVEKMDLKACNRATVESLSENLTDSILTPLFFYFLLGVPGLVFFKIVSTMDSMIGYKNEKYIRFGTFAAKLDDLLNFIPARLSLMLIALSAFFIKGCSFKSAWKIGIQQHHLLPSPNSGYSEAAAAGALKIKLGGQIWYGEKMVNERWIGSENDSEGASSKHIYKTIKIILLTTFIFVLFGGTSLYFLKFLPLQSIWSFSF